MLNEADMKLDIDKDLNGVLIITCPQCKASMKKKLKQLSPNKKLSCQCGCEITISGDGFKSAQKSLDDLRKALSGFGS